ncbi:hypothetical protein ISN45_Aa07g040270 [Arabidopsis thaliana x Arabidopsis arenosa]|uniref:RING-type E3 ubiquitin transferase n=1 Tax=Arabidopsis thaliana x Arabidopsis arenosa TaxID=1240361 RepID=A0A8T1YDX4_9BRAS|nr:hypothetical protein ISN45_Aa07g040270 [Arabidopsis thaliana x Arabidopsis arenosa]
MIPLHSAVASARLRSSIAADSSCWSLLSQGEITAEKHKQAENLFVTFHCYCSRKEIQCLDVMLEDDNIVKSLAEYVSFGVIENLVLGAPSRHGFMRKFKISDTPSNVAKAAPDSAIEQACSVK